MVARAREIRRTTESHVAVHRRDPQTLAYAMADSPAGLGAWLWHRRQLWCDGDALEVFGRDDLCTLSSLYWFNTSFASSIRLYAEQFTKPWKLVHDREPASSTHPRGSACSRTTSSSCPARSWSDTPTSGGGRCSSEGGHFAPAEQPDVVVDELRTFFRDLR